VQMRQHRVELRPQPRHLIRIDSHYHIMTDQKPNRALIYRRALSSSGWCHRSQEEATGPACPDKHVTAHTLRHTCAMRLLLHGVDVAVIALWLGHAQVSTTNIYLHADMNQKEQAIARVTPLAGKAGRYR
ncbi:MAG: tyrosine-type recombinase/integrase, partial [Mycobacteriales bacterium]